MWIYSSKDGDDEYSVMIYIPNFLDKTELLECEKWLDSRYNNKDFRTANEITYNKYNRKQIWFQEDGEYFCKKWKNRYSRWESNNYDTYLRSLQDNISRKLNNISKVEECKYKELFISLQDMKRVAGNKIDISYKFNSVLVNLYENGHERIQAHRDSIDSFGLYPTIVGLSIGETRTMRIRKIQYNQNNIKSKKPELREENKGISMDIPLENNSLFIMMGSSQKHYTHEILREPKKINKRYSFTFRNWIG